MRDVVIAGACRTAIGRFLGGLADVPAVELGSLVVREALARAGAPAVDVDEAILGQVLQAGCGCNPARQAALLAGLPETVPGWTVNKVCASGMKAVAVAALSIAAGENEIVVAGGMENMSAAPYLMPGARRGLRLGDAEARDCLLSDALRDPSHGVHMGLTAERLAEEFGISRAEQDRFAALSQRKAAAAQEAGGFEAEIVSVDVPQRKGPAVCFAVDEHPRPEVTPESLARLKPAFKDDGTVTAGNSSGINDGAAAMVLLSAEEAERRGIQPMGRIVSYASAALDPMRMGMGPVSAVRAALAKAGLRLADMEAVELNEAFAAQCLAVIQELGLDPETLNLNGGAIALGHPVGATGARMLVTLLHVMADRGLSLGLAALCVGGGQGMAMVVSRE